MRWHLGGGLEMGASEPYCVVGASPTGIATMW